MPARLIVQQGPNPNEEILLNQPLMRIGRGTSNEIVLQDPEVSRQHAQITQRDGICYLDDLGSTNGTFLNTQRVIGTMALEDNDTINLGESIQLLFVDEFVAQEPFEAEHETFADKRPLSEQDTPPHGLPPFDPEDTPSYPVPPYQPSRTDEPTYQEPPPRPLEPTPKTASPRRRLLLGCGCLLLLLLLCTATLFFLDAYDQGRLLYCGPIRPLFELLFGPFGFAPACG
ncbi:MAG: FHA domain-containing protein [Chloroflexota bacterium]